jgi:hypothetical protein
MFDDTTKHLPLNCAWYSDVKRAHLFSSLIKTKNNRTINDQVLQYIKPCWKLYIMAMLADKPFLRADLDRINERDDLTSCQKSVAIKLYYLMHRNLPRLVMDLGENTPSNRWKPELTTSAGLKYDHKPALFW